MSEHLRKGDYVVLPVHVSVAQGLVARYHYSKGGSLSATFCHGLYHKDDPLECLGVAWWIPPTEDAALSVWSVNREVLALTRLVIVPDMPTNAASFLLSHSIKLITKDGRFKCLLTYADEWRGHTGAIYRATNWEYLGLTAPHPVWVNDETGRMVANKTATGGRTKAEMVGLGCTMLGKYHKHKFRYILKDVVSRPTQATLFDSLA